MGKKETKSESGLYSKTTLYLSRETIMSLKVAAGIMNMSIGDFVEITALDFIDRNPDLSKAVKAALIAASAMDKERKKLPPAH